MANLKVAGFTPPAGTGGVCQPISSGTDAQVRICFAQLWQALAVSTFAIDGCLRQMVGGAMNAWRIGAICSMSAFTAYEGFDNYLESTQVREWANQSAAYMINGMRQAIYERMVKNGRWSENAGCC